MPLSLDQAFLVSDRVLGVLDETEYRVLELVVSRGPSGQATLFTTLAEWPATALARAVEAETQRHKVAVEAETLRRKVEELNGEVSARDAVIVELRRQIAQMVSPPQSGDESFERYAGEQEAEQRVGDDPTDDPGVFYALIMSTHEDENVKFGDLLLSGRNINTVITSIRTGDTKTATLKNMPGFVSGRYQQFSNAYNQIKAAIEWQDSQLRELQVEGVAGEQ